MARFARCAVGHGQMRIRSKRQAARVNFFVGTVAFMPGWLDVTIGDMQSKLNIC
jgi:hypothetical protein